MPRDSPRSLGPAFPESFLAAAVSPCKATAWTVASIFIFWSQLISPCCTHERNILNVATPVIISWLFGVKHNTDTNKGFSVIHIFSRLKGSNKS